MRKICLYKVTYLFMVWCSVFYFSCSNDWISHQLEDSELIEPFDASVGAVEIQGSGTYFIGTTNYSFRAIAPVGWEITTYSWSVEGAGGVIQGSNSVNPVTVSFNYAGYADVMFSCQLKSGNTTRNHIQVLTIKVMTQQPVLTIDREVDCTLQSTYRAGASYSPSIDAVTYEWDIPDKMVYNYTTTDCSEVEFTYPGSGEYTIGVRAKDGTLYSDWVYETVKVTGDYRLVEFNYEFDNTYIGESVDFTIIMSHNYYPASSQTYYEFSGRIPRNSYWNYMDNDVWLMRGNYTLNLMQDGVEHFYQITLDGGGGLGAIVYPNSKWAYVLYCDMNNLCVYL